jgi:RNA recognition motif-containing protein
MASIPTAKTHPTKTVCVTNLPNDTTEADVRALFSDYGAVRQVRLFTGECYRRAQGYSHLDLSTEKAESAVAALDGHVFNGSIIRVSHLSGKETAPEPTEDHPALETRRQDDETPSNLLRRRYEVASVEKTEMPDGGEGGDWYRYVLSSGRAQVTGLHRGSLEEVTAYATSCAEDFNLRSATGRSARAPTYQRKK